MMLNSIKMKIILAFLFIATGAVTVSAIYVPNSRETSVPPETVVYDFESPDPLEYTELYSEGDLTYYFRESRGTIAIYDNRNDYFWKTGTDLEYNNDIDDDCDFTLEAYEDQFLNLPVETFAGFSGYVNPLLEDSVLVVNNGELKANNSGIADTNLANDIQFSIDGFTLENGKTYQLSFVASGLQSRDIQIQLGTLLNETVTVLTDDTVFTYTFEMTEPTSSTEEFEMFFGYIAGQVNTETTLYLDNFSLVEFDGVDVVADTNQMERGDLELLVTELTVGDDELLLACRPKEVKLNTTYTGFANSILTIEYYDDADNIKRVSSSSYINVNMDLKSTNDASHWVFEIDFKKEDIEVVLNMYLDSEGIRFEVLDDDVTGEGVDRLAAIIIAPFMGASGGAYEEFDLTELDYGDQEVFKYRIPGYSLVPDGSGTLIRYNDNTVKLNSYEGAIYGFDPGQADTHMEESYGYVPFKQASMPVFGMAHGNDQAAFVSFAIDGEEYMQVISMPDENLTYYNFTYPRFEYNKKYFQIYNKSGAGYLSLYEERNHFDINIRYNFLSGDGTEGPSADYVGMAQSYRAYLISQGLLSEATQTYADIPIRLDFLMSDAEKGITGFNNQVTTTTDGVNRILSDVVENGISNINSGLLGWQDGGISLGDPSKTDYVREIGRERDFKELIQKYNDLGIDISFEQDYYNISEEMMTLRGNAAQHTSGWYARVETFNYPISMFYYARPSKSIEWLLEQTKDFNDVSVNSYSISGITNNLITDDTRELSRSEAKQLFIDGFAELDENVLINAYQPNMYLWQYTDRYLQTPIYGTQFLIESDTVPFLQLVLQNTMELYGPYSNFSFYTDSDILRMIDYNLYPNFVLTDEPAYLLSDTLSRNFYSTEYELYQDLIVHLYGEVNNALGSVINANWIDRTVVENGIVVNEYDNGVIIVINYTDTDYVYESVTVTAESYHVIGG